MTLERLDHLVLTVRDADATCEFYRRALGMEVVTFGQGRLALRFGAQKLNLHAAGREFALEAARPTPGSADLCFLTGEPLDDTMVRHFDQCLGCMACVTACPSGVQYDRLIESTRSTVERRHRRPLRERALRSLVFSTFPYPRRLRALRPWPPQRPFQCAALPRPACGVPFHAAAAPLPRPWVPHGSGVAKTSCTACSPRPLSSFPGGAQASSAQAHTFRPASLATA